LDFKIRRKRRENSNALIPALHELGFELNGPEDEEIRRGKDFIQLKNGPFDLDLIFAPDGIERFEEAWSRRIDVEGFHAVERNYARGERRQEERFGDAR
jgi:hypothetical protein